LVVLTDFDMALCGPRKKISNIVLPIIQIDFIDGLMNLSLSQVNYIRNTLGLLLDLCLVKSPDDPYHPSFDVIIDIGTVKKEKPYMV